MFSTKLVDGASRVADAQDLIADNKAPKKNTCAINGICVRINVGNTRCGSARSSSLVFSGIASTAQATMNIGTNANARYESPPITAPREAVLASFADITRWKTSCCGIEPSIIVIAAAKKKTTS